jgi:hypothetical protein
MADRVVLQVELAKPPGLSEISRVHERRHADVSANQRGVVQREKLPVAPDAGGAGGDSVAAQGRADGGIVVVDLEGTEAVLADVDRALWDTAATLAADKPSDMSHEPGPPGI